VSGAVRSPGSFGRLTFAAITLVTMAYALVFARVPWPYIDLYNNLQRAHDLPWGGLLQEAFASGVEYRPLLTIATKTAFAAAGLHLWFYKAIVLLEFAVVLFLMVALFQPAGRRRSIAAVLALACLVGLPTSRALFMLLPLNAYSTAMILVLLAAWLAIEPWGRQSQWWLAPLTLVAMLWLELGVLIVPLVLVAWWLSAPGVTRRGAFAALGGFALYVVLRRAFGASLAGLTSPESGFGFDDISPQQIQATFAHAPWLFWLYNVAASTATVALSEPRAGKFKFVSALLAGRAGHWQWLQVMSSLATSLVVVAVLIARTGLPSRDRVLAAFGLVLIIGGSALGFLYTRDRISFPVGIGYALLVYVAVAALLERSSGSLVRGVGSAAVVGVLGACWLWRTGETGVWLRDRAWENYLEWTVRYHRDEPESPLLQDLHRRAIARRPPDPRRDPVWTYEWFERAHNRVEGR
jgi:hypothetical protein